MKYLSPVYAMLHLLGHKTEIHLKVSFITEKSRIIFFASKNSDTWPLFKMSKILKSFDKTALSKCVLLSKSLKQRLPSIFSNQFKFSFESHLHDFRQRNLGCLKILSYHTKSYGRYSMFVNALYVWNHLQKSGHQNVIFLQLKAYKLKEL